MPKHIASHRKYPSYEHWGKPHTKQPTKPTKPSKFSETWKTGAFNRPIKERVPTKWKPLRITPRGYE